ncbi:MAG: ABC transporter ATP-binding protein [Oscillospiraceae bacterium]|nr:ABC transporter ATP-binding protein [Oscillospiraceae bacterium]
MNGQKQKGMWKRTLGLFRSITIPWYLYLLQVILGLASTKVALLYIPYMTNMQMGNFEDGSVIGIYLALALLSTLAGIVERIPSFYAQATVARRMQNRLIEHALRLNMRSLERSASQLVSWITQDCSYADGLITSVVGFLTGMAAAYMSITSMSAIDLSMVGLVPVILIYICFSTWLEGKLMFLRERRGRRANAELTAYLAEHLSFFTQIKQLHSQQEELQRGKAAIRSYFKADVYQAALTLVDGLVGGSLSSFITVLVFVMGVPLVNNGSISLTELAAFQNYIILAYQSLSSLPSLYTSLMYYNGQLFYISSLMAEPEEVYQRKQDVDEADQDLVFDGVSFGYGDQPVLRDASFTIPRGKLTLVVGPNGSGKTTLFKLIERFYTPDSGAIYFGSCPAEDIHLPAWRKRIAYVLQEPQLFDGTIRDNITYGLDRPAEDGEVAAAARLAQAEEFIAQLPGGYDFEIGENGSRLSGGQRQRLAIARALMLNPACLLLDEATCNLDLFTDRAVTDALMQLMQGRTTVMISHNMELLTRSDHVIVLNGGQVEASGPPAEAEAHSPVLQALLRANHGSI